MMKLTHILTFFILVFGFVLTVPAQEQTTQEQKISWYAVSETAMKTLLAEEKKRLKWEAELEAKVDKTPEEWLLLANLALRNGHDDAFLEALKRFEKSQESLFPEKRNETEFILCNTFYAVANLTKNTELARKFAEAFPGLLLRSSSSLSCFFNSKEEEENPEVVLQWVSARYQAWKSYRAENSATRLPSWTRFLPFPEAQNPWYDCRLEALRNASKLETYLDNLKKTALSAENTPEITSEMRMHALLEYLSILRSCRYGLDPSCDLSWVASCTPERSSSLFFVAGEMFSLKEYTLSRDFAFRALETPVEDGELTEIALGCNAVLTPKMMRNMHTGRIYNLLTRVAQELNEPEEAQKWMLKEKELSEKTGMSFNCATAGAVQTFSGQRVVENVILKEEKELENQNSAEYWWKRAEYYQGCGAECVKELEDAYLHVLEFRENTNWRWWSLQGLADLYYAQGRKEEAKELLTRELRERPREWGKSTVISYLCREDRAGLLDPDLPELWTWLEEQKSWEFGGEKLLRKIFKTVNTRNIEALRRGTEPGTDLETYCLRAEKLATTPDRAAYLGWIFNRMGKYERSLPLLKLGEQSEHENTRNDAAFTCLESLMSLHRWVDAERQFIPASEQLSEKEVHSWLNRLRERATAYSEPEVAERCARKLENLGF